MAGLYIHIPYCKKACHYCDFHFTQSIKQIDEMVDAICVELEMQKDFLGHDTVYTIYFGGGTPSLLGEEHLRKIMRIIQHEYSLSSNPEVTLEGNPDDLTLQKLTTFFEQGINRLSIGVQSFNDEKLKWMNRQHSKSEAIDTFHTARQVGFENISLDLIYALPHTNHDIWLSDLKQILALRPEHISSYCLTIEPKTAFGNWLQKGKIKPINEDFAAEQFEILLDTLSGRGYDQYEISNFALPGYESQHNSAYWKDEKYLGIGPSAHSYNGKFRKANVANNGKYLKGIGERQIPFEVITLSPEDQVNEYLLTSLRTKWGCDLNLLKVKYDVDLLSSQKHYLNKIAKEDLIFEDEGFLILTDKGKLLADKIASDLFI
ncbi:radical SAM family heme chaperone HemW [Roseivirga misakiensis]|uniref:Heme chaperone HemW n=1 Tax=Roseivirga misakiensis TaxID=1563681 RepID=A0A1E5T6A7_9BACT|nr:radical SAM family heme chaperone HemW [Roseivirga misakiensis]OEK06878.1 coproporphyrinogen III oxidase [Roseivirga misakiensis]